MTTYIDPQAKVLWHSDRIAQLRDGGQTSAPVNVEIDLSNRCSHGCEWCAFSYTHTKGPLAGKGTRPDGLIPGGDLMPLDLARSIIDQLAEAGVKSITWTGGGEPTLHPDFDAIVAYAQAQGLQQGLYTHGGHIDLPRASLLRHACTWVYVSLDCVDRDTFKAAKGVNRFDAVCEGIRTLAGNGVVVGVGCLLHENNIGDIDRMVALARDLGAHYVQFRPAIRYDAQEPGRRDEHGGWIAAALDALGRYSRDPFVIADRSRFTMYQEWRGHGYSLCHWAAMQTVITPNGMVWTCVNKREHADALAGDLSKETFAEVWARVRPAQVDGQCRVMCRGHMANLTLDKVLTEPVHADFV